MTDDAIDGWVGFETDGQTLRVCDALEGEEFRFRFDREPQPKPALPDLFPAPVDQAVSFEAESVSIPSYSGATLRDATGDYVARLDDPIEFPRATYILDLSGVTKVFVRIPDSAISTSGASDDGPIEVTFDRTRPVTVGARSLHTKPEATVTVPDDPTTLTEAVSVLGSSIKEFTPERSWPTLRGYPPRIRIGETLDIPSPLVAPDTGVSVVVRPTYADVYRLATLTFYLGAEMVVGDEPAIRLDNGYEESLPTDGVALEDRAEELLRTWLFLDTLARTEGYVESDRREYEAVGAKLPFYPPKLADISMSDRLMEYLEVDPETVAPYTPPWPTEAVLRPVPAAAELLPHLAHVLAPIRVRGSDDPTVDAPVALATSPWLDAEEGDGTVDGVPSPDATPLPSGTAILTPSGYGNRLSHTLTARGDIDLVVVTDSTKRATEIRRALADPAPPDGIGSWTVIDDPTADTVRTVLSDATVDIAYCTLPTEGDQIVTEDGPVSVDSLGSSPALTVFEAGTSIEAGTAAVDNGGLSALIVESALSPKSVRSLIGLLSSGVSTAPSVFLSGDGGVPNVRIVGDPGARAASTSYIQMVVIHAWSESPTSHRLERSSTLSLSGRIGIEQKQLYEEFDPMDELSGKMGLDGPAVDSAALLDFLGEGDCIVCLNGCHLSPERVDTEADIERLAKESLAEAGDSQRQRPLRSE